MKSKFASRLRVLGALVVVAILLAACGSASGTHIIVRRYARIRCELQARCFADLQQHRFLDKLHHV